MASLAVLGKILSFFLNYANSFLNPFILYSKEVIQKAWKEVTVHLWVISSGPTAVQGWKILLKYN